MTVAERRAPEPDDNRGGSGLADALRRYVDALVGMTEVSRERAEKIVSDLAKRGETRAKDIQQAARELADRSSRNQRELVRLVQKEIKRQVESLGLATRDDVGRLQRRVKELEKDTPASSKSASSKAAPAKRAAASRKRTTPANPRTPTKKPEH
jgi:polyhydroxyalkanoate synthesis regulator phasin